MPQAVAILGAVGGFLAAYAGPILTVASIGASIALQFVGKSQTATGPRLGDTRVQVSTYGNGIPKAFGRVRMAGNVIWVQNNKLIEVRSEAGGKGGMFGGPGVRTYSYFASAAIKVAEADPEATAITRIWADKKLVYDRTGASSFISKYEGVDYRFYLGTSDQDVDPLIEAEHGAETPAYRGSIYIVMELFPCADFGMRLPNFEFEVQFRTSGEPIQTDFSDMNDFEVRDIALLRNSFWLFGMGTNAADNGKYIFRFDLAENQLDQFTETDPYRGELGFSDGTPGVTGFDGECVMPGEDGRLLAFGQDASDGRECLIEVNPFTLGLVKRIDVRDHYPTFGNWTEVSHITWTLTGTWGTEVFSLIATNSTTVEGNHLLLVQRRKLVQDSAAGLSLHTFNRTRDSVGSMRLNASCVDRDGVVWMAGYHSGVTADAQGRQALMVRVELFPLQDLTGVIFSMGVTEVDLTQYGIHEPQQIVYDQATHSLLIFGAVDGTGNSTWIRWDITTELVAVSRTIPDLDDEELPNVNPTLAWDNGESFEHAQSRYGQTGTLDGKWVYRSAGHATPNTPWRELTVSDLTTVALPLIPNLSTPSRDFWHVDTNSIMQWGELGDLEDPFRYFRDTFSATADQLDEVLGQILRDVQLDPATDAEFDFGVENTEVQGYILSGQMSGRDAIEPLAFAYLFDIVESDGKLKFVTKGAASARTLSADDLGAGPERPEEQTIEDRRGQETELPQDVSVRYLERARDYMEASQNAPRQSHPFPTQESGSNRSIVLPIVMTADEAKRAAEANLYEAWAGRRGLGFSLGPKHLDLDPTDVVTVETPSGDVEIKLDTTELGQAQVSKMAGTLHDAEVYDVVSAGIAAPAPSQALGMPGPTKPLLLDIPLLRDPDAPISDDQSGIYIAFGAMRPGWRGAILNRSEVGAGGPFEYFETAKRRAAWGYLATVMPVIPNVRNLPNTHTEYADNIGTIDADQSITIDMVDGSDMLQSRTAVDVLGGNYNALMIQDDGADPEIVQFLDVVDNGDGTITLSTLIRGRRGTEEVAAAFGHAKGALVVFLDQQWITRKMLTLSTDLNIEQFYKTITLGEPFPSTTLDALTLRARDLKPYAANQVATSVAPGAGRTGNVIVTWSPRSRLGGEQELGDLGVHPSGESIASFEVGLLVKTTGVVSITKTASVPSTGVTFTSAERVTAGYTAGEAFRVKVYQLSAAVGRGFARDVTI